MQLHYAVISQDGAWRLFRGDAEIASFTDHALALRRARSVSRTMAGTGSPVELLLHDRFGEVSCERFAAREPAGGHVQ